MAIVAPTPCLALSTDRDLEPVVVTGEHFTAWNWSDLTPLTNLRLYRVENGQLVPIPFQVDKRRKVNLKYNVAPEGPSHPVPYDVCEYSYFPTLYPDQTYPGAFDSDQLQPRDEVVFMLADAGTETVGTGVWPAGDTDAARYRITLADPRDGDARYVYAYMFRSNPPAVPSADYVQVTSFSDPTCTLPGPASCNRIKGTPAAPVPSSLTYEVHFLGNWIVDEFRAIENGADKLDLLDRIRHATLGETEETWSTQGHPRFLGLVDGPIRALRGVQGAQSGVHTTRYDFVYPTVFETVLNQRVHALEQHLLSRVDHTDQFDADLSSGRWTGFIHTETKKVEDGEPLDQIGGDGPVNLAFGDTKYFDDWTELLTEDHGSYVHLFAAPRPAMASTREFIYTDGKEKPADSEVLMGGFGRRWNNVANTADGVPPADDPNAGPVNDGGCPANKDPESDEYLFARYVTRMIPQGSAGSQMAGNVNQTNDNLQSNADDPMLVATRQENRYTTPPPGGGPCIPSLQVLLDSGGPLQPQISQPCQGSDIGYLLYRGEGTTGTLRLLRDLGSATSYVDRWVEPGVTYRYAVRSYNPEGALGALSASVSAVSTDTVAPAAPTGLAATPGPQMATVTWSANTDRDVSGYKVYISDTSGGPYVGVTPNPIEASRPRTWVITGLDPTKTWYVTMTAVDYAGNESAQATEVSVLPDP
ncbi:MAG: hypothetical protein Kow0062_29380 [Acidobacteriota bacterium]